jgi:hypothetical protein
VAALLSAVDAVSPALDHARRHLFQPFRFAKWARLAVITLLSGELVGGGGGGGTGFQFPAPSSGGNGSEELRFHFLQTPSPEKLLSEFLPWIVVAVAAGLALALLFLYINSVFRFILFDAVLNDRWRLREAWSRWTGRGASFFLWQLGYGLLFTLVLGLAIGVPVLLAVHAGWFKEPGQHVGALVMSGLLLLALLFALIVLGASVAVLAKDFVIPIMALDDVGVLAGWSRAWPRLSVAKLSFVGYLGMKIVLAIAAGIVFGILTTIAVLVVIVPLAILVAALAAAGLFAGFTWTPAAISAGVVAGLAALAALLYLMAFVSVPVAVFFQSYTLHFYAGRYPALETALAGPSPTSSG